MASLAELRTIQLVLTTGCNLRCRYCYQNRKSARGMPWETARAAVDLLMRSRRRRLRLVLLGGEPLANFELFRRVVDYTKTARPSRKQLEFFTTTNGTLLDRARTTFLVERRIRTILSFDGAPGAQHLRGAGTFEVLDRLLTRLRRDNPAFFREHLTVGMTLVAGNIGTVAESVRYFLRKGVRAIDVNPRMTHDPDWNRDDIASLDRECARVFRTCRSHYRRTGDVPFLPFRHDRDAPSRPRAGEFVCSIGGGETLAVDVDGQVYGCVVAAESLQVFPPGLLRERLGAMRLGDVHDTDLGARLAGYPDAAARAGMFTDKIAKYSSYGRCSECRHLAVCTVCPMSIGYAPGNTDPNRIPDLPCAWNLVAGRYQERFPVRPQGMEWAARGVRLPERLRRVLALGVASRMEGTRQH